MLDLSSLQQSLLTSAGVEFTWLFLVEDVNGNSYQWSTVEKDVGGTTSWNVTWNSMTWNNTGWDYTFRVIAESFTGIKLARSKPEYGIQAPSETSFEVTNADDALTASDFEGGTCKIDLFADDGSDQGVVASWRFEIKNAEERYKRIKLTCQDILTAKLKGSYPNTRLVSEIWPSLEGDDFGLCLPVPIGTAYIPLQSFYHTGDSERYYMIGSTDYTFGVTAVHTPSQRETQAEWLDDDFTLSILTKADADGIDWQVLAPLIADSDSDGTADSYGTFRQGSGFLPIIAQLQRDDTLNLTNPADAIAFILNDFGILDAYIDTGSGSSFATASSTYDSWGLEFDGGFTKKESRAKLLSRLLAQCNSYLSVTDKVELHVRDVDPVNSGDAITTSDVAEGSWDYDFSTKSEADSAYVAWQSAGEPQDRFTKALVPSTNGGSKVKSSGDVLLCDMVQDSQHVQKIGTLYYQWRHNRSGSATWISKGPEKLAFQPNDVIAVDNEYYGGSYNLLINSMHIRKDMRIKFSCLRFSALSDWDDLSPSAISPVTDATTNPWSPAIKGPSSSPSSGSSPSNTDELDHDQLLNYVADEHIDWTASVAGKYIHDDNIKASNITQHEASIDHDNLLNFAANEHIDWTSDQGATNIHANNLPALGYADQDGDVLDISWNPSNYTPDSSISEADDADDLSAHLKGIDDELGSIDSELTTLGTGESSTFTIVTAVQQDSAGAVEYKTRDLTFTDGRLTTLGAESAWTAA